MLVALDRMKLEVCILHGEIRAKRATIYNFDYFILLIITSLR